MASQYTRSTDGPLYIDPAKCGGNFPAERYNEDLLTYDSLGLDEDELIADGKAGKFGENDNLFSE